MMRMSVHSQEAARVLWRAAVRPEWRIDARSWFERRPSAKPGSSEPNACQALVGRADGPGEHLCAGSEPLVRGTHAYRSGGFVTAAYNSGRACHPIERALRSHQHPAVLSVQHLAEGCHVRIDRGRGCGNSSGRDNTGGVQDLVAVEGGEVDRFAELTG
jgi:hypothetical protein